MDDKAFRKVLYTKTQILDELVTDAFNATVKILRAQVSPIFLTKSFQSSTAARIDTYLQDQERAVEKLKTSVKMLKYLIPDADWDIIEQQVENISSMFRYGLSSHDFPSVISSKEDFELYLNHLQEKRNNSLFTPKVFSETEIAQMLEEEKEQKRIYDLKVQVFSHFTPRYSKGYKVKVMQTWLKNHGETPEKLQHLLRRQCSDLAFKLITESQNLSLVDIMNELQTIRKELKS